jgi:methionyl-tRNA formyltransferase
MKIAFFWTWDFSKNILEDLLKDSRVDLKLVVSQPDKPIGRKKILKKTPVKILAEKNNIKVLQPEKLRTSFLEDNKTSFLDYLDNLELDFILVVAYWKIVPKRVLESTKYWCINLHWSILPNYRWASPIQESVKNWDNKTWLTVMFMSKWMDEWDILEIEEVLIDKDDKTQDIFNKFENFGAKLAIDTLDKIINWEIEWISQEESKANYCSKIYKEDWEVKFSEENAESIYNKYRSYYNWPWIYCNYKDIKLNIENCYIFNENLLEFDIINSELISWDIIKINKNTIWMVCLDKKILILKQVKLAGKNSMDIISFINGNKDFLDYKF